MSDVMRYDLDVGDEETRAFMTPSDSGDFVQSDDFDRITAERDALQLLLNDRDEQLHTLEQSRRAHFENAQAAERRIDDLTRVDADDGLALIAQHRAFIELGSEELIDAASDFQDQAYALGLARGRQKVGEAADQRIEELTNGHSDEPVCKGAAALGTACGTCARCATLKLTTSVTRAGEKAKGMIETACGTFAIMIDEANPHYGWTFRRHPDGMWVSGRKATDAEMNAARAHAKLLALF